MSSQFSQSMSFGPVETTETASQAIAGAAINEPGSDMSKTTIQGIVSASDVDMAAPADAGDAEKGITTAAADQQEAVEAKKPWCCMRTRRRKLCCLCCSLSVFFLAVAVAIGLPLLWPRDPDWTLTKLELLDESALMSFVQAIGAGYETISDDAVMPALYFMSEVELTNPNRLGGSTGEGSFKVFFREQELGNGTCSPAVVKPLSNVTLQANISVNIYPAIFKDIAETVLADNLKLTVQVSGSTEVTGPLGIKLIAGADCDILTSVIEVMSPATRKDVIESKTCTYKYKMLR